MVFKIIAQFRRTRRIDRFIALWHRLFRLCLRLGYGLWLYRLTIRGLAWVYGIPWVQERFFRQHIELMKYFLAEIGLSEVNLPHVVQDYLLFLTRKRWKLDFVISQITVEELSSLITFENWPFFQQARSEGRGVLLLLSHMAGHRVLLTYMNRSKICEISIGLARKERLRQQSKEDVNTNHVVLFTRDLLFARQVLKKGGVVIILPDGNHGRQSLELPFFDKPYQFRTGFAELASMTNATVIPVVVTPQDDGRVIAKFASPFDYEILPPSARERALIEQYVAHLEQMWRDTPGTIELSHRARFMRAASGGQAKHPGFMDERTTSQEDQ